MIHITECQLFLMFNKSKIISNSYFILSQVYPIRLNKCFYLMSREKIKTL